MIDLVLVSHGGFSAGLKEAAEMIMGEQENMKVLGLFPGDTVESFATKLEETIDEFESPENVLILADLNSGTPSNASMMMVLKKGVTLISGVNLPMLLEVLSVRDEVGMSEVLEIAVNTGRNQIFDSVSIIESRKQ